MAKKQQTGIESAMAEVQKVVKDNKMAVAASTVAYAISDTNKERNALLAGIVALAFFGNEVVETDEDDDDAE